MTTVANMPVGSDGNAKAGSGSKSSIGNRDTFLGGPAQADGKYRQVSAGTMSPGNGPGHGLPSETAGTLTSVEKPRKNAGV